MAVSALLRKWAFFIFLLFSTGYSRKKNVTKQTRASLYDETIFFIKKDKDLIQGRARKRKVRVYIER